MANDSVQLTLQEAFADCKYCKGCDSYKPLDEFARNPGNKRDGRQPICKRCSHSKLMAWHANNRDKYPAVCVICGTNFTSSRRNAKCCSRKCSTKAAADTAATVHIATANKREIIKTCKRCGQPTSIRKNSAGRMRPTKADHCRACGKVVAAEAARLQAEVNKTSLRKAIEGGDYVAAVAELRKRVDIDSDGCWNWRGVLTNKNGDGYPFSKYPGPHSSTLLMHRILIELQHGKPLGTQHAHHMCANTKCVNPDHLQPVTHRENAAEMLARQSLLARIGELEVAIRCLQPDHEVLNRIPTQ